MHSTEACADSGVYSLFYRCIKPIGNVLFFLFNPGRKQSVERRTNCYDHTSCIAISHLHSRFFREQFSALTLKAAEHNEESAHIQVISSTKYAYFHSTVIPVLKLILPQVLNSKETNRGTDMALNMLVRYQRNLNRSPTRHSQPRNHSKKHRCELYPKETERFWSKIRPQKMVATGQMLAHHTYFSQTWIWWEP